MKRKITGVLLSLTATICTFLALSVSASACSWSYYQPEEPECLRNKTE